MIIRACAQCELEHGLLNRSDPSKSHGLCKRHTIDWARAGGLPETDIRQIAEAVEDGKGFPPDLGPVLAEWTCPICGAINEDDWQHGLCWKCGHVMSKPDGEPAEVAA